MFARGRFFQFSEEWYLLTSEQIFEQATCSLSVDLNDVNCGIPKPFGQRIRFLPYTKTIQDEKRRSVVVF